MTKEINENYFSVIDTQDKGYWLGFMYGDGFITKSRNSDVFGICLKAEDKPHLEKFKQCIESDHKISEYLKKNTVQILITRSNMVNDLIKHGCLRNKSQKDLHIPNIREDLIKHFIRGLFDADGCITNSHRYAKTVFTGSKTLINEIQSFLLQRGIVKKITKSYYHNNNCVSVEYFQRDSEKIFDYLYSDANIYLDRKYNKFKEMI